jgi:hypothetical protein
MPIRLKPLSKIKDSRRVNYQRFDFVVDMPKSAMLQSEINKRRIEVHRRRVNRSLAEASRNPSNVKG